MCIGRRNSNGGGGSNLCCHFHLYLSVVVVVSLILIGLNIGVGNGEPVGGALKDAGDLAVSLVVPLPGFVERRLAVLVPEVGVGSEAEKDPRLLFSGIRRFQ